MNMADPIVIRQLGPTDAAAYRALRLAGLRAFPHAFRPDYEEALRQPLSWAERRLAKEREYWFGAFEGQDLASACTTLSDSGSSASSRTPSCTTAATTPSSTANYY
jgi:hypothetical protein